MTHDIPSLDVHMILEPLFSSNSNGSEVRVFLTLTPLNPTFQFYELLFSDKSPQGSRCTEVTEPPNKPNGQRPAITTENRHCQALQTPRGDILRSDFVECVDTRDCLRGGNVWQKQSPRRVGGRGEEEEEEEGGGL